MLPRLQISIPSPISRGGDTKVDYWSFVNNMQKAPKES